MSRSPYPRSRTVQRDDRRALISSACRCSLLNLTREVSTIPSRKPAAVWWAFSGTHLQGWDHDHIQILKLEFDQEIVTRLVAGVPVEDVRHMAASARRRKDRAPVRPTCRLKVVARGQPEAGLVPPGCMAMVRGSTGTTTFTGSGTWPASATRCARRTHAARPVRCRPRSGGVPVDVDGEHEPAAGHDEQDRSVGAPRSGPLSRTKPDTPRESSCGDPGPACPGMEYDLSISGEDVCDDGPLPARPGEPV